MISFTDQFNTDEAAVKAPAMVIPQTREIATLTQTALAPLQAIEQDLRALAERYRDVAFDLKTAKGLGAMKAARYDLRENGRYLVQRAVQKCKDDANAAKKAVEQEAVRLVAITGPRETEFDEAIVARENELAAEKAEAARIEAERVAKHRAGIETIRGYVAQAQGKTAAQITQGIGVVAMLTFGDDWEEFAQEAVAVHRDTLAALESLRDAAAMREAEAARIEAQRIENARVAEENALIASIHANASRIEFDSPAYIQKAINYFESGARDFDADQRPRVTEAIAAARQQMAGRLASAQERERIAAEQAERQRALDEQAAALKRQSDAFAAAYAEQQRENAATAARRAAAIAAELATQETPPQGANRDASAEQSHGADGSESPTGRGTNGAPALGAAPVFMDASQAGPASDGSQTPTGDGLSSSTVPAEAGSNTPALESQQVLKAEPATADATDRETPATRSPVGGPMGAEQPAAAGLADDLMLLRDALAFTKYAAAPFFGKFPSHPKTTPEWWAGLREQIECLQPLLITAIEAGENQQ